MSFKERYVRTLEQVAACCEAAGRDPREVRVLAVSKTVGCDDVAAAIAAGAQDFGENRPDMLKEKADAFPRVAWHFIGNVQSRRLPDIVSHATLIHSLYQNTHFGKCNAAAEAVGKVQDILLEVNVSGEQSKSGLSPDEVPQALDHCMSLAHLRVRGLMTMAPQGDRAVARECFERLAHMRDDLRAGMEFQKAEAFNELSMGMSEDWHEAVGAGATIVRIGRALFDDGFEELHA